MALPKVTFSSPPIAWPAVAASCSVLRRIQSASGMIAAAAPAKTHTSGAPKWSRASDSGTRPSAAIRSGFMTKPTSAKRSVNGADCIRCDIAVHTTISA